MDMKEREGEMENRRKRWEEEYQKPKQVQGGQYGGGGKYGRRCGADG